MKNGTTLIQAKTLHIIYAELRETGYKVPEDIFQLLLDPKHANISELRTLT